MLKGIFDVEPILQALGVKIVGATGAGRIKAYCPKHPRTEHNPRHWSMDPETGAHHCFSCGYGGSLVGLVCDLTGMNVWDALGWLRSEGLQNIVFERPRIEDDEAKAEAQHLAAVTAEEQWGVFDDPPQEKLDERYISFDAARYFDVRWSTAAATREDRELLLKERAWAFALVQWDGAFLGYQLKSARFVKNVPTGVKKDQTLFGIAQFPPGERAILVESPLDAVLLHDLGYHALAIMGSHLSVAQAELLLASTNKVIVALDYDEAGRQEARRLVSVLRGMHVTYLEYRVAERREDGKRPKDVGEMTDVEVHAVIRDSKLPHECGKLLGLKPEPKRQYTRTRRRYR